MKTHRRVRAIALALVAALAAVAVAGGIITVAAQTNDDPKQAYLESLAGRLGVDVETLEQAIRDTNLEQVDRLLENGVITEEQAQTLRERIENSDSVWFGVSPHARGRFDGVGFCGVPGEELATFLGTDVATLREELASGMTLAEVAEAHGKTRDELKTFLTEQFQEKLDEAVANGRLTEEEAQEKLEAFTSNLDALIDGELPGKPAFGRHRGPWWGAPEDEESSGDEATSEASLQY